MCVNVTYKVLYEHHVCNRQGGSVPWRNAEDTATLRPGRAPSGRAGSNGATNVLQESARCLYASCAFDRCKDAGRLLGGVRCVTEAGFEESTEEDFCVARGVANVEYVEQVGGGLNLKRWKFVAIMDRIEAQEASHLIIAHKDRLVRFGFAWFERFCAEHGAELLVLNQEQLSPEHEMVQDLLTIVNCFSARLYGLRNYRKKLNEALKADVR